MTTDHPPTDDRLLDPGEVEQLLEQPGWTATGATGDELLEYIVGSPEFECAVTGVSLHATDNRGTVWAEDITGAWLSPSQVLTIHFGHQATLTLENELLTGKQAPVAAGTDRRDASGYLPDLGCYAI